MDITRSLPLGFKTAGYLARIIGTQLTTTSRNYWTIQNIITFTTTPTILLCRGHSLTIRTTTTHNILRARRPLARLPRFPEKSLATIWAGSLLVGHDSTGEALTAHHFATMLSSDSAT